MDSGTRLGPYEIQEQLGAGGMGEVYLAEDTRLRRQVALKVLLPGLADDEQKVRRFEQEARVVAALNHPNIVTLHSIEHEGDSHFLTMEVVDGRTLDRCIPAGGMPLEQVFDLGIALSEAVAAAHARGITHRDLKPSNIMVTGSGFLKVLDFGLAKLREVDADSSEMLTLLDSGAGKLIGTVAYMSPEQAEGAPADARSDVFALGVILYEMLQGHRPFAGSSPASIMSAILRDVPTPVRSVRRDVPRQLDRILDACLAKDPDRRYQSALDLRNALESLRAEITESKGQAARRGGDLRWPIPALMLLGGLAIGWGVAHYGWSGSAEGPVTPPTVTLTPVSRDGNLADYPTWSPDGRWLLYASDRGGNMDLWRVEAEGGEPERLTETELDEVQPAWSPSGDQIAYVASSDGEPTIHLLAQDGSGRARPLWGPAANPAWSPDGRRIVFDWGGTVYVIAAAASADADPLLENTAGSPSATWNHDGSAVYAWNWVAGQVQRVSLATRQPVNLDIVPAGQEVVSLAASPDGTELLMSRGQYGGHKDLWAVPLDVDTGLPSGDPVRLTNPVTDDRHAAYSADGGSVAYGARQIERHLWRFPLEVATGKLSEALPEQLTWAAPRNYYPTVSADGSQVAWTAHPSVQGFLYRAVLGSPESEKITGIWARGNREIGASFAPDGERIVYASPRDGSYELWQVDCVQCPPLPLTRTDPPSRDSLPAWSPAGERVVFMSTRGGSWDLWSLELERGAEPQQLTTLQGAETYPVWAPDGLRIAYRSQQSEGTNLWQYDLQSGTSSPLVVAPGEEAWGGWDPDGTRFYFSSNRTGAFEIWLSEDGAEPVVVTNLESLTRGLPDAGLYTKFAVTSDALILPLEDRRGEVWLMER